MFHGKPSPANPVGQNVAHVTAEAAGIGRTASQQPSSVAYSRSAAARNPLRPASLNSVEVLRRQEWLKTLEPDDLGAVARYCRPRSWKASAVIFQRDDDGHEVILVCSGRVRLSVASADGRELSLRFAGPGAWLGEIAVLCGTKRTADATASTDVEALIISRRDLDKLMDERPSIAKAIARHLCDLLRATTGRLEAVVFHSLGARLARFLLELAELEGASTEKEIHIEIPYSRAEIAGLIGASRPKVSAAFSRLEKMRAIRRISRGYICNIEGLRDVAEAQDGV